MRVLKYSTLSPWLLEVLSLSPVTTQFSEYLPKLHSHAMNLLLRSSPHVIIISFQQQLWAGCCTHLHYQWLHLSVLRNGYLLHHRLQGHWEIWRLHGRVSFKLQRCLKKQSNWDSVLSDWTHLNMLFFFFFFCSNILKLMNAFNYAENNITESNYQESLTLLNQTAPAIIQGLQLQTCDMQSFLSQVNS